MKFTLNVVVEIVIVVEVLTEIYIKLIYKKSFFII